MEPEQGGPPVLDAVHAFDLASDFDGGRFWVTVLERWQQTTALNYVVWTQESVHGSLAEGEGNPWRGFVVLLADDQGTDYRESSGGGGSGGDGRLVRGHEEFSAAVPPTARRLTVHLSLLDRLTRESELLAEVTLDLGTTAH